MTAEQLNTKIEEEKELREAYVMSGDESVKAKKEQVEEEIEAALKSASDVKREELEEGQKLQEILNPEKVWVVASVKHTSEYGVLVDVRSEDGRGGITLTDPKFFKKA